MAISQVRAQLNGTWYTLTYNSATGAYEATLTAPGTTSYNQTGGYYNVTVEATNTAGTSVTADGTTLSGLQLVVRETVAPVIAILSPTSGAYVTNARQPVIFTVTDETGGSGVNLSTLSVTLDEAAVSSSALSSTAITNGYSVTYTPVSALADGAHTVVVNISDNDGNAAAEQSTTFTVDTVAPTIDITSPADGLVTASASLNVTGTTNDATSSPVTVKITLNGTDQGAVTVDSGGSFSKTVTLSEGSNTIVVTVTDAAGQTNSVTRTVELDTSVPEIRSATITPNPADTGASVIIRVVIA